MKKEMKKFQETHNWSQYVLEQKHKKVDKLRKEGVLNAWNVVNYQAKPLKKYIRKLQYGNVINIPKKYIKEFNFQKGDKFEIIVENGNIVLKRIEDKNG